MSGQPVQLVDATMHANQRRVAEILRRLDREWLPEQWTPSHKPVDTLVATILSQNTSDVNTERAFAALRDRFREWHDVVSADFEDVIDAIRPGGLAAQKGPRIQNVLREVLPQPGEDPETVLQARLAEMTTEDAMTWLTGFRGIGPKTAACVLLFAAGKPVVPVDTHVYRVSSRIGLVGPDVDANRAHQELMKIVPPDDAYRFHVHLIRHGRTTCRARKPECDRCILNDLCSYARAKHTEPETHGTQGR